MATKREIFGLLEKLAETFGPIQSSPNGYYMALEPYNAYLFDELLLKVISTYKYSWPKPADLIEMLEPIERRTASENDLGRIFFRACSLCGLLLAGKITYAQFNGDRAILWMRREKGDRSWWASNEALLKQELPSPSLPDDRSDDEIAHEYDEWKRAGGLAQYWEA